MSRAFFVVNAPVEFEIKCHLDYDVTGPASLLLTLRSHKDSFQSIITEHFSVAETELCREIVIGDQRYRRITPQRGPVELTVVS